MRILLGALMCLVLTSVQCYAVKGGPAYSSGPNIVGTYAGVLEPEFDPTDPFSSNSLGIFSLGVPGTGLSTGTFVMFFRGTVFRGTIQGVGNPLDGAVKAVLSATFSITNQSTLSDVFGFVFTGTTTSVSARAEGSLKAKVSTSRVGTVGSATVLTGTADLFVSSSGSASSSPSPSASATATPSSGSSGGSGGTAGGGAISAAFSLNVAGFKQSTAAAGGGTATAPTGTGGT